MLVLLQNWTALLEQLGPQEQLLVPGGWRGSSTNWVFSAAGSSGDWGWEAYSENEATEMLENRRSSPNRNDMFTHVFVVQRLQRLQRSSYPNIFRQTRFKAQVVFLVERDLMPMLAVSALPPGSNGPSDQVSMNSLEPEPTKISFIPQKRFSNI